MATDTMECVSLDFAPPSKLTVTSAQRHALSECSEECELDGSYTEFVEMQWTKGSSSSSSCSDLGKESPCNLDTVLDLGHEIGSDTESVVVNAPLHGPTTVRCVCVCKKRGCKFVDRPFDAHSVRESPIAKVSARYRLVTWLSGLMPHRGSDFAATDQIDGSSKVHPEKKSKIIQMLRMKRLRSSRTPGGVADTPPDAEGATRRHCLGLCGAKKPALPRRLRECQVSVPRCIGVMLGLTLVMAGVTYDHGVKHGVDNLLQDCWSWLRTSYMNFGDEFVSYNSLFFRMSNSELYGEPYPKYGPNTSKNTSSNATSFKDAIKKVDPKFLFVLEGLKLSVQVHFFSIDEKSNSSNPEVMVHDRGPMFFRISFRRTAGLHVEFVPERSNMTLSTPFHIYDLMKMVSKSNNLPSFTINMHDYHKTTPSVVFSMIIENLKLFNVDTTFLSSIQAQIQAKGRGFRRIRRRSQLEKEEEGTRNYIPSPSTTEPPRKATAGTEPGYTAAPVTATRAAAAATKTKATTTTKAAAATTMTEAVTATTTMGAAATTKTEAVAATTIEETAATTRMEAVALMTTKAAAATTKAVGATIKTEAVTATTTKAAAASTKAAAETTKTTAATEMVWNTTRSSSSSSGLSFATTLGRARRSTEEPDLRKVAWRSLTEMSRKIFLPLPLDTRKTVLLPVPLIEKNLTLRYRHSVNVLGLPGYQFILGNDIARNGSPWEYSSHDLYPSLSYSRVKDDLEDDDNSHQQRHRYNDKKKHLHHRHSKHQNSLEGDTYRKSFNEVLGVVDLEPLLLQSIGQVPVMGRYISNYPFWLSPPHFLSLTDNVEYVSRSKSSLRDSGNSSGTRDSQTRNNLMVGVDGIAANESLHGSFIYYHPILGVPINASLAVQVGVRPPKGMLFSHKLVPIMWTRVQVEEVPRSLWYILWAACHLRETIMSTLIVSGLLIITCSLTCFRKKRADRPGSA
ncbi:uncharacterized protein LOC127001194 [Eriocheir sinensis]|uniref:uncharacterized protein LOC127001194 n=1 Tax=Eriocheir sinensis TaxID=95602 RepID=UPI0021C6584E|nr:uncharacterized protein LOC127001194 [Eriocheir sinensis]